MAGPITGNAAAPKRNPIKAQLAVNAPIFNKADIVPVIVPRTNMRPESVAESRKDIGIAGRTMPFSLQSKTSDYRKFPSGRDDVDQSTISIPSESPSSKSTELSTIADRNTIPIVKGSLHGLSTVERNIKDDRPIGSGKQDSNLTTELPVRYQEENCKFTCSTFDCCVNCKCMCMVTY